MPKRCDYEWVIETTYADGEVGVDWSEDNSGNPVFPFDLKVNSDLGEISIDIALRKTLFDVPYLHGGDDWFYAYVEDGKLPEFFENGDRIPKRFHNEIKKGKS